MFDAHKDGRQATARLYEHYEGEGKVNKCVAWATENIDNTIFTSKPKLYYNMLVLSLNKNCVSHSQNQMVKNMLKKIKFPNNLEMNTFKHILSSTNGHKFVNAVAYLSG